MNITLVLGSVRHERQSEKPAVFIYRKLLEAGHAVNFIDLKELNFPVFNDTEEQMNLPSVTRWINAILEAEAILIVAPEYNHSYSSALKNAIDFLRNREFMHRPVGYVGVSDGNIGGARSIMHARASLPTLGAVFVPTAVTIPNVPTTFPSAEECADDRIAVNIDRLINELNAYAPALKQVRELLNH